MAKKTYTALTPIEYNGESYAVDDPIELDDKIDAPQLLAVDAIKESAPKKPVAK